MLSSGFKDKKFSAGNRPAVRQVKPAVVSSQGASAPFRPPKDLREIPQILKSKRMGAKVCLWCEDSSHMANTCQSPLFIPDWIRDQERSDMSRREYNSKNRGSSFVQIRPN